MRPMPTKNNDPHPPKDCTFEASGTAEDWE